MASRDGGTRAPPARASSGRKRPLALPAVLLADFDYALAQERIAQFAIEPRDAARLLVDQGSATPLHLHVRDIGDHLRPGDVLVVNDSKVIPARLRLQRHSGGAAEVLLIEPVASTDGDRRVWEALVRPGKKLQPGERLLDSSGVALVEVGARTSGGDTFRVTLLGEEDPLDLLAAHGDMPLPPYITAPLERPERYQTVYANEPGSVAAPTAGLHFTPELLAAIESTGVRLARVELVVGLDTFRPMTVADPRNHRIHSERYRVTPEVLDACRSATRVIAVGTTATRALESAATFDEPEGRTRLFIHRGYEWKLVDLLMTNFHLPKSTLLVMIDAFVGSRWRRLYEDAAANCYRFLSFGDSMLLDRRL
ncbi:MAG: tRNA preQ1(34) S-adenosylmethionine ribosyltransferase-isomerase QueA [Ilumatobacteraceae bacterium]